MEFFRESFGNYGWAIIGLTFAIKLLLLPVSLKQMSNSRKTQSAMALIKPEIDKLQEKFNLRKKKYENDPAKLEETQKQFQEEMMAVYKTSGALNPMSGCLLMLVQLPVLIALYWACSGVPFQPSILALKVEATDKTSTNSKINNLNSSVVNYIGDDGKSGRFLVKTDIPEKMMLGQTYNLELVKEQGTVEPLPSEISWNLLAKDQDVTKVVESSSDWANGVIDFQIDPNNPYKATIKANKKTDQFSLQTVISSSRGHQSFFFIRDLGAIGLAKELSLEGIRWDILVLVIFTGITFWVTNQQMSAMNPTPPSLDPGQADMQKQMQTLMPLMFFGMFFFMPLPAGVFVYFITSNLFQILQTYLTQLRADKQSEGALFTS